MELDLWLGDRMVARAQDRDRGPLELTKSDPL